MEIPHTEGQDLGGPMLARWLPSALMDLAPTEPVTALRTPHRICLQSLPTSRDTLAELLGRTPFEITIELETDGAPLRHVPIHEVHEARLTPDLPLDWAQYYWLADGLQEDLFDLSHDPAAGLARGRARLAVAEETLREFCGAPFCDTTKIESAWMAQSTLSSPDVEKHGEPAQALQQYVRGLTGHLVEHATSRVFVDRALELLQHAERRPDLGLPPIAPAEARLLSLYAQHRLFGGAWLTAPAGMIAGWHLLLSVHVLAVWYAGLLLHSNRETRLRDALLTSLWMLDQGLWRDEALVHDVLRNLNASEYTSPELAAALTTALRGAHVQA
jgi:hypothetical protein